MFKYLVIILSLVSIAACGGSGGGNSDDGVTSVLSLTGSDAATFSGKFEFN